MDTKYKVGQAVRVIDDISDSDIPIGDLVVIASIEFEGAANGDDYFYHIGSHPYTCVCNDEIELV